LKHRSSVAARFALRGVALAVAALWASQAAALGLGRLNVQSALGETLRAEIEVTSITAEEAGSLKLRIAPPEAYRAAGVDYNAVLTGANVQLVRRADGRQVLRVNSDRAVLEPFVDVIVEATWSSGRLVREYTMLFDPPSTRTAVAPPAAAPVIAPAPEPAPAPSAAAPAPAPRPARPAPAEPAPRVSTPATTAPAPSFSGYEYRVRSGDSLSRIAGRTQRPGVSLDQMLVSLFRANPDAFMGDNMNRLKAGTVLTVPSAEEAAKVTPQAARELIQAQSADFGAYRQRLASGAAPAVADAPARQAAGKVQTQVDDRKTAAAPTPDRLTLSQGGVKAGAAEAKDSKATETKDNTTRLAELARNVDDLKKLQGATTAPAAAPAAPAPAPAAPPPAPAPSVAPTVTAAAPPVPAPAPAPVAASAPAPVPAPAPTPAPAPAPVAAAPMPAPAAEGPGLLDSLSENSLLLPAAGVLVALLGGLGLYRLRGRLRKPAGETSFLESRLQPDSFFGASGGQRIDTREGAASTTSGNSSSMSYSLSQLDAIGDVDPVAEADVYLAYGRDLQAEEILKEAMRANPERMAIRSKLLEVYAKRRDAKGFELLASQMFNLTRGEGEDWAKAQEMGRSIDPDNVLYQPGGAPEEVRGNAGQVVEPLGASTVPYTAPAPAPSFEPAADATLDDGLDLDIDIPLAGDVPPTESTRPMPAGVDYRADDSTMTLDMAGDDPKTVPVKRPATADIEPVATTIALPKEKKPEPMDDGLDFDLGDLGSPAPAEPPSGNTSILDFGDFSLPGQPAEAPAELDAGGDGTGDNNPLARKLELAEEFRQIGDLEGARDLLEEVVSKADGALKSKAQGMLDKLG
jgi:pilus assembly protein FimV